MILIQVLRRWGNVRRGGVLTVAETEEIEVNIIICKLGKAELLCAPPQSGVANLELNYDNDSYM